MRKALTAIVNELGLQDGTSYKVLRNGDGLVVGFTIICLIQVENKALSVQITEANDKFFIRLISDRVDQFPMPRWVSQALRVSKICPNNLTPTKLTIGSYKNGQSYLAVDLLVEDSEILRLEAKDLHIVGRW